MSMSCTNFYKIAFAFIMLPAAAYAAPPALPPELMNNGQPIDPLCFESVSADEWLDINECAKGDIVKVPGQLGLWADDKIGYTYRYKEDSSDATSYSYYQYVGQYNGSPVILSFSSGGGTGQFSSLMSIERNASKIRVLQGYAAGDRCNGGVVDAKIGTFGTLQYGQNMTPIDFLQLAEENTDLQPYEDLEASAASCFGIARFENEKFTGVSLSAIPRAEQQAGITYKYQDCFNKLFITYLANGKKELSVSELKEFTGEFNKVCLPHDQ